MDENSPVFENFLNKMRGSKPIREIRTNISAEKLVGRPEPQKKKISSVSLMDIDAKITTMTRLVVSIADTLKRQEKLDLDILKFERQKKERQKRKKRENILEKKKPFGVFTGIINTIAKPIQGLFSQIFGFFKELFFGRVAIGVIDFINRYDPNSVAEFLTFFGKNLPAIIGTLATISAVAAAMIAFMKLTAIPAMIAGMFQLVKANPLAVAGGLAIGTGGFMILDKMLKPDENVETKFLPRSDVFTDNSRQNVNIKKESDDFSSRLGLSGGGLVPRAASVRLSGGGKIPGSGNSDSVPSMLTPGEFVMSKGAVEKFGSGTLAAMNAMGGGTNVPMLNVGGTNIALGNGGSVPNIRMANGGMMPEITPFDFNMNVSSSSLGSEPVTTANIQNSNRNSFKTEKEVLNIPQSLTVLGADPNKTAVLGATTVA